MTPGSWAAGRRSRHAHAGGPRLASRATRCALRLMLLLVLPLALPAQGRGAAALVQGVERLGEPMRVLMIGAHPDDEDTNLLAWLARGRHVETAYLSLTRGDGGQNLIGNELGEALGAIRTEELLAARRIDGAHQYFTRAFDFGFSKNAEETYQHWPHDSVLGDVVRIVRAFKPHVIVAVFSGTPRDGHGHHQVSGLLAREAYELAGDPARFPATSFGLAWTPSKFYRSSRFNRGDATLAVDVGAFDPVLGRSYAELAAESRSQHKSQGFGMLQPKGPATTYVRREASRVPAPADPSAERSIFDGIDTTWSRFAGAVADARRRAYLDSVAPATAAVRAALDVRHPAALLAPLARVQRIADALCGPQSCLPTVVAGPSGTAAGWVHADFMTALQALRATAATDVALAAGVELEAAVPGPTVVTGHTVPVRVTVYNRGTQAITPTALIVSAGPLQRRTVPITSDSAIAPGTTRAIMVPVTFRTLSQPRWLLAGRSGDLFAQPIDGIAADDAGRLPSIALGFRLSAAERAAAVGEVLAPIAYRTADPALGQLVTPVAVVPAVSVTLDQDVALMPANTEVRRTITVHLRSADSAARQVVVRLALPSGLAADSVARTVTLAGGDVPADVTFSLRGRLAPGTDSIRVVTEAAGQRFTSGYQLVEYPHIEPRRLYHAAALALHVVDVRIPPGLTIAYVPGVGDNVAPALRQLGIPLTVIEPSALAGADLSRYGAVVVGPRAYQAYDQVMAARGRLLDYARAGGTLVVQYQQNDIQLPGVAPYPMTIARPADRVTIEEAPVTVVDPSARVLTTPNRIGPADFEGWVQERSTYMPRTFDQRYQAPLSMHDPGEEPNRGAILVAPVGRGTYVYVTLALFRQLPAGVPGAARLFVNLLGAGQPAAP